MLFLRYNQSDFDSEAPLDQKMHKVGPGAPLDKFFVYTANTNWGIQNLENGATGMNSLCGYLYFPRPTNQDGFGTVIGLYKFNIKTGFTEV